MIFSSQIHVSSLRCFFNNTLLVNGLFFFRGDLPGAMLIFSVFLSV